MENHNKHVTEIKETLENCIETYEGFFKEIDFISYTLKERTDRSRELTEELAILDNFDNPYPERRLLILSEMDNISGEKCQMELELNDLKEKLKRENNFLKNIKKLVSDHNIDDENVTEYLSILENLLKDAKNYIKNSG